MAEEFARMLTGVTADDLERQWRDLERFAEDLQAFAPRPVLLVAAGQDNIFPASDYTASIRGLSGMQLIVNEESDHGFSACRPWLVRTVTDWLVGIMGC
jgi:hypothetical protein